MKTIKFLIVAFVLGLMLVGCSSKILIKQFVDTQEISTITVNKKDDVFAQLKKPPIKDGFSFKGWFFDKEFKNPVKRNSKFVKDTSIYAKIVENKYDVFYFDVETKANMEYQKGVLHTIAISEQFLNTLATKFPHLTLDSYYIDEKCQTKFSKQENITKLYVDFKAKYTYHNGFEEVKTELVPYGKVPEKLDIDKMCEDFSYMDSQNIKLINQTDPLYNLISPAIKNTDILVKWQSKGLQFDKNEKANVLTLVDFDDAVLNNPTVISIPGIATFKGNEYEVREIKLSTRHLQTYSNLSQLIIDNNIKSIINLNFTKNYSPNLEKITIPSEVVIIENSFNALSNKVNEISLPDGLKIIISSFWDYEIDGVNLPIRYFSNKNLTITLPDSVENLANIPANVKLQTTNPHFVVEGNRIYTAGKDTLIAAYDVVDRKLDLTDEKTTFIHALALDFISFDLDYLCLSKTFQEVKLFPNASDYKFYTGQALNQQRDETTFNYTSISSYADRLKYIVIDQFSIDDRLNKYFITALKYTSLEYHEARKFAKKILLTGENNTKATQQVLMQFIVNDKTTYVSFDIDYNEVLDNDTLLEHVKNPLFQKVIKREVQTNFEFSAFLPFIPKFKINDKVTTHLYLLFPIDVELLAKGNDLKYKVEANEITITGINNTVDELYLPRQIDGKYITKIGKEAFKDNNFIQFIYLPNTIKIIDERAFFNASMLNEVAIQSTNDAFGIEVIKREAFAQSALTTITLPLAKMTSIEPYAFKTFSIKEFLVPSDEINRVITNTRLTHETLEYIPEGDYVDGSFNLFASLLPVTEIKVLGQVNQFYILKDGSLSKIMRYKGSRTTDYNGQTITILDVELIASANKCLDGYNFNILMLGTDAHHRNKPIATICYELMEGSVYLEGLKGGTYNSEQQINLVAISKAHKNAIYIQEGTTTTKINPITNKYINIKLLKHRGLSGDAAVYNDLCFLTKEDMKDKTRFPEGWINFDLMIDKLDYCETPGSI